MLQRRPLCAEGRRCPKVAKVVDEERTQWDGIIRPVDITVE